MVTAGIFKENSHGRTGNRTRDFMIIRQRLWPLDHKAGPLKKRLRIACDLRATGFHHSFERLRNAQNGGGQKSVSAQRDRL